MEHEDVKCPCCGELFDPLTGVNWRNPTSEQSEELFCSVECLEKGGEPCHLEHS